MLNRRSLLIGAGSLAAQLLTGCGGQNSSALRVELLADSVPAQLLGAFQRQQQTKLDFGSKEQLADLFELLQTWKQPRSTAGWRQQIPLLRSQPPAVADLVTLGDSWLTAAIQQNLVQPLDVKTLAGWQQLPPAWKALVQRDRSGVPSPQGEVWAAPYRWGTLAIAYRREPFEQLNWVPQDWSDLWRSELRGKISLLDSPRSVIGLTLKKLGSSFNAENLDAVPNLAAELQALHRQTKFYDSDNYLQPLLLGDTWAAIGWSSDLLPVLKGDRRIAAVVPRSGTLLSADLWVRPAPAATAPPDLLKQWIDFCWQPEIATQLSLLSSAVSPLLLSQTEAQRASFPKGLRDDRLRLPSIDILQHSEFLQPLAAATVEQYRRLWTATRQGN